MKALLMISAKWSAAVACAVRRSRMLKD